MPPNQLGREGWLCVGEMGKKRPLSLLQSDGTFLYFTLGSQFLAHSLKPVSSVISIIIEAKGSTRSQELTCKERQVLKLARPKFYLCDQYFSLLSHKRSWISSLLCVSSRVCRRASKNGML